MEMTTDFGDQKAIHPFFSRSESPLHNQHTSQDRQDTGDTREPGVLCGVDVPHSSTVWATSHRSSTGPLEHGISVQYTNPTSDTASPGPPPSSTGQDDMNDARRKRRKITPPLTTTNEYPPDASPIFNIPNRPQNQGILSRPQAYISTPVPLLSRVEDNVLASVSLSSTIPQHVIYDRQPTYNAQWSSTDLPRPILDYSQLDGTKDSPPIANTVAPKVSKMLKLNSSGRLYSPEAAEKLPEEASKPKKKGRPPKRKAGPFVVVVKYGSTEDTRIKVGNKITAILTGLKSQEKLEPPSKSHEESAKSRVIKQILPGKITHPFFRGKPNRAEEKPDDIDAHRLTPRKPVGMMIPSEKRTAVTPGKLRNQAQDLKARLERPVTHRVSEQAGFSLTKYPGMSDPPWPWKDNTHVRGDEYADNRLQQGQNGNATSSDGPFPVRRKGKQSIVTIDDTENVVLSKIPTGSASQCLDDRHKKFNSINPALRVPQRLLTTGYDIRNMVKREISTSVLAGPGEGDGFTLNCHPVLTKLYNQIDASLTPFDNAECETRTWAQKYAPQNAAEALQSGREATVFRDWLQNHIITSVEDGTRSSSSISNSNTKTSKKKRRKAEDIDDFIVENDVDDLSEMEELSDCGGTPDELLFGRHRRSLVMRSAVRKDPKLPVQRKTRNAILLSGPHGCGKTALVHAVAKEMDFEVFEINAGSRRSGKDILDKVGNMSENHLVHQHKLNADVSSKKDIDSEGGTMSTELDAESSRQASLSSFFGKSNHSSTTPIPTSSTTTRSQQPEKSPKKPLQDASSVRSQKKQSFILLEEVDILFQEDKPFWTTILSLITSSRRPLVMTCTDENLVHLQESMLHAILRLKPPPTNLATDYMLLLAACEGHILQRSAVSTLYKTKKYDLRASIMDLDFWCQMAIGDLKGGLEWFYQRWPPTKHIDEHGQTLRVASRGTYIQGMGLVDWDLLHPKEVEADPVLPHQNPLAHSDHEFVRDLWDRWAFDLDAFQPLAPPASRSFDESFLFGDLARLDALASYESFASCTSDADFCCRVGLRSGNSELIDPTLPGMLDKARLSYTDGYQLLEAGPIRDYSGLDLSIATSIYQLNGRKAHTNPQIPTQSQTIHSGAMDLCAVDEVLAYNTFLQSHKQLTRWDFAAAFDVLADAPSGPASQLTACSWDRPFRILTEDLAPYVRNIVACDMQIEDQRMKMSGMLSVGGSKRLRTTRASRAALDGGPRQTSRKDKWFTSDLNGVLVLQTGGRDWAGMGARLGDDSSVGSVSRHGMEE